MLTPPMRRAAAGLLIAGLGVALAVSMLPYVSGLLGAPMLYVIWAPVQRRMSRRLPAPLGASVIIVLTLLLIVLPGTWLVTMLVNQAQDAARAVISSPLLDRVREMEVGSVALGPAIASAGQSVVSWLGSNALSFIGTATRAVLNLVFLFFGLYFLLVRPGRAWAAVEPYIPFSPARSADLRQRFTDVTISTVIGTGVIAIVQGVLIGLGFWVVGIPNAVFWGAVTAVLSILPVVGSGLVWLPAVLGLFANGSTGAAVAILIWGAVVVANVDNLIRPVIYNRYARIHPMVTLVGAVIGVQQMGFIGLILGPLGISYFFELTRMFSEEFSLHPVGPAPAEASASADPPPEAAAAAAVAAQPSTD